MMVVQVSQRNPGWLTPDHIISKPTWPIPARRIPVGPRPAAMQCSHPREAVANAVEAQRPVVPALAHALLLQKVNGQNSCVSAVSAAKCERPIFQIGERRNGTSANCDDLCHPAEIGVAHGNRAAGVAAPLIRL